MLFIAPGGNLAPPRTVVLGKEDLTVPARQVEFCGVVPVLHASEAIREQQCLTSTHGDHDQFSAVLIMG